MSRPAAEQSLPAPPRIPMLRTLGLVAALSGLLVVLAHQLSTPLIEENKRIAIERALFKVVPGAVSRRDFLLTPDGIEALGKILAKNNQIPVILNTAYASYKDNFMSWSADAYVIKSSDMRELKDKISEILANRGKTDDSGDQEQTEGKNE